MNHLPPNASLDEVYAHIETAPCSVLLFVDQSTRCREYSSLPWVRSEVTVVELDAEIADSFQVGKIPQFRFYIQGNEVNALVGTVSAEAFEEVRNKVFQNVSALRAPRNKAVFTDL